jgi:apolipoprotein D and lipocalin family protein
MQHWFAHLTMSKAERASRLEKMKPATPVELDKFMGRWYNIEAFPWSYVKGCTDQQAVYTRVAGKPGIKIQNSCLDKGKLCVEEGLAEPAVADGSNGQLIVNFEHYFASFSTRFTSVNLCVIAHFQSAPTAEQYEYAMVGTPELDGLWLMSRSPLPIPPAVRDAFLAKAQAAGFNIGHLQRVDQQAPQTGASNAR